jgi:cyclopropane fatty-acyl-phospholipid synthase-like methyltransferase
MVTLVWMDDSMTGIEEEVARYYERFRSKFEQWWAADKTLGIHFGYYDKGVTSHVQSIFAMNDFTWSLLQIPPGASATILDVGCGVGGTSIYLARKHPQASFTGIDIVPTQINLAIRFAEQWGGFCEYKIYCGELPAYWFPRELF